MRCNTCNRFVSFEEQEPEINGLEIDNSGHVTADVRIVNSCDQCGEELTEYNFQTETDVTDECEGHTDGTIPEPKEGEEPVEHELEVAEDSADRTSRSDGKPGTPSRYRRTFYGYSLSFTVTCSCGKLGKMVKHEKLNLDTKKTENVEEFEEGITGDMEDEVQASGMDELQ